MIIIMIISFCIASATCYYKLQKLFTVTLTVTVNIPLLTLRLSKKTFLPITLAWHGPSAGKESKLVAILSILST